VPVAIVTGAARGIGEAIARRLHGDGHEVALTDIDVEGAERVAAELGVRWFRHDVRELSSWEAVLEQLDDVHVLVNNAARTEFRGFFDIDLDEWDDVLATNLRGTYLGCRVLGSHMRERGAGRIVNLASDAAFAASGGSGAHYAASKAGVEESAIDRIMGPCGLDIGADTQEETALSILAEILAVRGEREGGFLKHAKKRIDVEVE
jgi:3-oxoacyl-[acyl-carrier protein] reductase